MVFTATFVVSNFFLCLCLCITSAFIVCPVQMCLFFMDIQVYPSIKAWLYPPWFSIHELVCKQESFLAALVQIWIDFVLNFSHVALSEGLEYTCLNFFWHSIQCFSSFSTCNHCSSGNLFEEGERSWIAGSHRLDEKMLVAESRVKWCG